MRIWIFGPRASKMKPLCLLQQVHAQHQHHDIDGVSIDGSSGNFPANRCSYSGNCLLMLRCQALPRVRKCWSNFKSTTLAGPHYVMIPLRCIHHTFWLYGERVERFHTAVYVSLSTERSALGLHSSSSCVPGPDVPFAT